MDKKSVLIYVLLVLLVGVSCALGRLKIRERGFEVEPSQSFSARQKRTFGENYQNSYAMVIGINGAGIKAAENDAESVRRYLAKYGFDNVVSLLGETATEQKIETEFEKLKNKMKKNDRFLFFFAGHGKKSGLVVSDATIPFFEEDANKTKLGLYKLVASLPAKHKLVILDSCYSGGFINERGLGEERLTEGMSERELKEDLIKRNTEMGVTYVMAAAGENEKAIEVVDSDGYDHGVFSKYLVLGLKGKADLNDDGIITNIELKQYIEDRVAYVVEKFGRSQTPKFGYIKGNVSVKYLFIVTKSKELLEEEEKKFEDRIFPIFNPAISTF